jgi:membrane protease YdiL (CAAX protease family)
MTPASPAPAPRVSPPSPTRPALHPLATAGGLLLAVFGTPALLWTLQLDVGDPRTLGAYVGREVGVFALLGLLLLLVRKGEGLPWTSMGWRGDRLLRSLGWGLLGVVPCAIVLVACVALAHVAHWRVGLQAPPAFEPPLWATSLTMLRAGVTEEAFYRGYAIERLQRLTGSAWVASALIIVPFALFHYRQGPAGIVIAGAVALVLSALYVKRRDLLAVMVTHFCVDFVPNVLLPLLGAG